MSRTRAWLRKRQIRLESLPRLEDALLGISPLRYAMYRLRLVGVRALLRTVFRLAELALFSTAYSFDILGPVLIARSLVFIGEGLWWGALETLRRDVRALCTESRPRVRVVRQWMSLGCGLAAAALLSSVAYVLWGPSPFSGFDVIDVFVLGCAARFSMDSLARTYHSGVYATRRVYRPAWSILLVDIADIVALVSSYLWLGAWGLGLALVVVGLLRTTLSVVFTRRVYEAERVRIGPPWRWFRALRGARWSPSHSIASALGNAVAQMDALLVLVLLAAPLGGGDTLLLAALFHGVGALQAAAFSWSRLFYFDFKRLEAWGSPFLLRRFEAFMSRVALWVPLPVGLLTLGLLAVSWNGPYLLLALGLTALAAVRARLSLLHVRAYSLSDHRFLRRLCAGMLLVVGVTPLLGMLPPEWSISAVALVAGLGSFLIGESERQLEGNARSGLLGFPAWLRRLVDHPGPVHWGLLRVDRRLSSIGKLLQAISAELGPAYVARLGAESLVWFRPRSDQDPAFEARVVVASAGTLRESHAGPRATSGAEALGLGLPTAVWQRHVGDALAQQDLASLDLPGLCDALRRLAPSARCFELGATFAGTHLPGHAVRELTRLVLEAARGHLEFTRIGSSQYAVLAPGGEPRWLVAIADDPVNGAAWKAPVLELLRRATVRMTLQMVA